ncbi:MAG: alanine racemase [Clostridia bacterium]|nr:alanine racemase [Clostridia bacterium]
MRPTVMQISTRTIVENAGIIRENLPDDVRMLCVIKADAYGHGSVATARALCAAGVDAFAVAITEEGETLRDAGIGGMILVLGGGGEASLRRGVDAGISQAVYTPAMLDILQDEAGKKGQKATAHLKIDTGMSRIGVRDEDDLKAMLAFWRRCPDVAMEGVFTHFCAADSDPSFTRLQKQRFDRALALIRDAGFDPLAHAAASSAMLDASLQYDMVRPGIALYGSCVPQLQGKLSWAQKLATRPVRIQRIPEGDSVGYGRTFIAGRDTLVMTLPIGYGDGYPRILGNRAEVLVRGHRAPVIGRVCMDMIMVDVTHVPEVTLEDEVVVMGSQGGECISPDELAELAQTIPYEIMLGFSKRIPVETVD